MKLVYLFFLSLLFGCNSSSEENVYNRVQKMVKTYHSVSSVKFGETVWTEPILKNKVLLNFTNKPLEIINYKQQRKNIFFYDNKGDLVKEEEFYQNNAIVTHKKYKNNNIVEERTYYGMRTHYSSNSFDHLTKYMYNVNNKLIEINEFHSKDSLSHKKIYEYDSKDNKISENVYKPDGNPEFMIVWSYDNNGNIIWEKTFDYIVPDDTIYKKRTSNGWEDNKPAPIYNKYGYEIETNNYGSLRKKRTYEYDVKGNLINLMEIDPYLIKGNRTENYFTINFKYNKNNLLTEKIELNKNIKKFELYKSNRPTEKIELKSIYKYDSSGNIAEETTVSIKKDIQIKQQIKYAYNSSGNLKKRSYYDNDILVAIDEIERKNTK